MEKNYLLQSTAWRISGGELGGSYTVHSLVLVYLFAWGKNSPEEDFVHLIIEPEGLQQCFLKYS